MVKTTKTKRKAPSSSKAKPAPRSKRATSSKVAPTPIDAVVKEPNASQPSTAAAAAPVSNPVDENSTKPVNARELLMRVAARADMRPNKARAVYQAVLAELGDALENGEVLNLPPLGKISVNRKKERENVNVMMCKIRRKRDLS